MSSQPYFNRDLSWLEFNERVLAQAMDPRQPLLERVKFCAIYASNLDEFFMKRVGLAKRRAGEPREVRTRDGLGMPELLMRMRARITDQQQRLAALWTDELVPSLAAEGVRLVRYDELSPIQRGRIDAWFDANVFPILTPLAVDPSHRFPFISNLSENLGIMMRRDGDAAAPRVFARVKIPSVVPRFVPVDLPGVAGSPHAAHALLSLDDLIRNNLDRLFPGMAIELVAPFRVTRSAAVALDDEDDADDVLELVEDELRRRRFAAPVRLETTPGAPSEVIRFLRAQLNLTEDDVYTRGGPLEYADLFEIVGLPKPSLRHPVWTPALHPALRGLPDLPASEPTPAPGRSAGNDGETIFDRIRRQDILLHHPYESFAASTERFIAEAAADPRVLAIKQTIYRTGPDSPFVKSLIQAAEDGKNVACLVELRARFDEERNVTFARQLELAGVHVAYGVVGLKTHCKLSLVVRQEDTGLRAYAHIGTGNYHPKTAQLYTDLGLLTADPELTSDAMAVFNTLTGHTARQAYGRFLVAPDTMRAGFIDLINEEADHARAGRPARIIAKMNQLEDPEITEAIYRASSAGVAVTCIVRGFCCLRPGVPGLSENVRVLSVVGRFLEHSRIFWFGAGAADPIDGRFYIGSADWMERNLSDRVELSTPVDDRAARQRLWRILQIMLDDRRNAWELRPDGRYLRLVPETPHPDDHPAVLGTFKALMRETLLQA